MINLDLFRKKMAPLLGAANGEEARDGLSAYEFEVSNEINLLVQALESGCVSVSAVIRAPIDLRDGDILALLLMAGSDDQGYPMLSISVDPMTSRCVVWSQQPLDEGDQTAVSEMAKRVADRAKALAGVILADAGTAMMELSA